MFLIDVVAPSLQEGHVVASVVARLQQLFQPLLHQLRIQKSQELRAAAVTRSEPAC